MNSRECRGRASGVKVALIFSLLAALAMFFVAMTPQASAQTITPCAIGGTDLDGSGTADLIEQSASPTIAPILPEHTTMTGTGVPGAAIAVTFADNTVAEAAVGIDGSWSVPIPGGLAPGSSATAIKTEPGKLPSEPVVATLPGQSTSPTIAPLHSGDTRITGTGIPGARVKLSFPDGTAASTTVGSSGAWSVHLPVGLAPGSVVATVQAEPGKLPSGPATQTVPDVAQSSAPTINPVISGDMQVSGIGVPGATVKVSFPDGSDTTRPVGSDGTWSAFLPAGLAPGSIVAAIQAEPGKLPSGPATQTVPALDQSAAPTINPIHFGVTQVSGTGVPGATVKVSFPDGSSAEVTVTTKGTWSVHLPVGLAPNSIISAVQTEPGKLPSGAAMQTVPALAQSAAPTINPLLSSDTQVTGIGMPGATIKVSFPDGSSAEVAVNSKGAWSVPLPDDLAPGSVISVIQAEPGKLPSSPATQTLPELNQSTASAINFIYPGDTQITGTGVPAAKIIVTLPNGETRAAVVSKDNKWRVVLKTALQSGDQVSAVQIEDGKPASSETCMAVPYPAGDDNVQNIKTPAVLPTEAPGTGDRAPLYAAFGGLMLIVGGALVYRSMRVRQPR